MDKIKTENDYFNRNIVDLIERYKWKFIVIKGEQVIGVFDEPLTAFKETAKTHDPLTFLIQGCQPIYPIEPNNPASVTRPSPAHHPKLKLQEAA